MVNMVINQPCMTKFYAFNLLPTVSDVIAYKAPPTICIRRHFQILLLFIKSVNKASDVVCQQTIHMTYQALFSQKIQEVSQQLSSAAAVIDALRDNANDNVERSS